MGTISGGGGRTTDAEDITSGTFVKERIPPLPTTKIAEGTFDLARIPSIDDARIPDLETLSYGAAFAEGQIPNLPTSKITSGTFDDARIPNIGLNDLEDVNTAGTVNGKVLTFQSGTWLPETPAGGGDMLKSVYDTDGDDIVDNSERLENQTLGSVQDHNVAAAKITSGTFTLPRIPGTLTGKDADSVDGADAGAVANNVFKIPSGIAQGDIFHVDAGGSVVKLSAGTSGHFLKTQGAGTNPQWAAVPGGGDMLKSVYDTGDNSIVDNSERLEGNTLGSVRDHNVPSSKITSGTLGLARIPTMDDARIPDLDTLSYGAAFGTAQIPSLGAYKIASGTLNADRIPALPTTRITSGTFNSDRIPILPIDRYGSAVLVSGTRVMEGDFTLGSHALKFNNMKLFEADADWLHLTDIAGSSFKAFKAHTLNTSYGQIYYGAYLMFDFYTTYIVAMKDLNMGNNKIFNLLDPTADQHAATKYYVDRHPKTLWVPVTFGDPASADLTYYGNYPVCHLTLTNYAAYMSFNVPDDFHSITEAKVVVIPRNTHAAAEWSVSSHYGAVGESYMQHSGGVATTYSVSNGVLFEVDISGIFTSLAAGDYVGIQFYKRTDWAYVDVLGVMFKYT